MYMKKRPSPWVWLQFWSGSHIPLLPSETFVFGHGSKGVYRKDLVDNNYIYIYG